MGRLWDKITRPGKKLMGKHKTTIGTLALTGLIAYGALSGHNIYKENMAEKAIQAAMQNNQQLSTTIPDEIRESNIESLFVATTLDACEDVCEENKETTTNENLIKQIERIEKSIEKIENVNITGETLVDAVEKIEDSVVKTTNIINAEEKQEKETSFSVMDGINKELGSEENKKIALKNLEKLNIYISAGTITDCDKAFHDLELFILEINDNLFSPEDSKIVHEAVINEQLNIVKKDVTPNFKEIENKTGYLDFTQNMSTFRGLSCVDAAQTTYYGVCNNSTGSGCVSSLDPTNHTITVLDETGKKSAYHNITFNNYHFNEQKDKACVNENLSYNKNLASSMIDKSIDSFCSYDYDNVDIKKINNGQYSIVGTNENGNSGIIEINTENKSITYGTKDEFTSTTITTSFTSISKESFESTMNSFSREITNLQNQNGPGALGE